MSVDIQIVIDDKATAALRGIESNFERRTALHAEMGMAVETAIARHLRQKKVGKPNRLGAPSTGFWKRVIDSIEITSNMQGARVRIPERGYAVHYYGGTIKKKDKALTIPISPKAHGKRVSDFPENRISFVPGRQSDGKTIGLLLLQVGRGRSATFEPLYVLKNSVKIPRDPDAMPADDVLAESVRRAVGRYVRRITGGGLP